MRDVVEISKLEGIKKQAQSEGWAHYIRTAADEKALLRGHLFSWDAFDNFRYYVDKYIKLTKGNQWAGKPMTLLPWHEIVTGSLFGWIKPDGLRRFRRGYIEIPKKNSKALCLETEIPTPSGFKKMGDLRVGDSVFAIDGTSTKITHESEVFENNNCYELTFSNSTKIVCDEDHLWEFSSFNLTRQKNLISKVVPRIMKASEAFDYFTRSKNPLLKVRKPRSVKYPEKKLDIEPYLLGYWLGDGTTCSGAITGEMQDLSYLILKLDSWGYKSRVLKYKERSPRLSIYGLQKKLRQLGVFGAKKIPEDYLFSSEDQRLDLLKGLLDSDGSCSKLGQITFFNTNLLLANQVLSLVRSLGIKATITKYRAVIKGKDCGHYYRVQFFPDIKCFDLERKAQRQKTKFSDRANWLYLKDIKKTKSVKTKCIAVDHSDKLFLVTRDYIPTHNTTLFGAIGLYMLNGDGEKSSEVYTCANSREQAAILWNIAADMTEADQNLKADLDLIRSTKTILPHGNYSSWFKAWSSDHSAKDGPDAHCVLVDELHEWKGRTAREFWRKIRYAGIARDQAFCPLTITTAGDDKYSLCWEQRTAAKRILEGISEDLAMFACIYSANEEKIKADKDYWKTEECWKEANPSYELILKKEDFEADIEAVKNDPVEKAAFLRYRLGVWSDSDSPWLESGVWDANVGPGFLEQDLEGQLAYSGLDLSSVHDFTAMSHVFPFVTKEMIANEKGEMLLTPIKKFKVIFRVYCPEDTFAERVRKDDSGSLRLWHEQGLIRLTPGDSIDHQFIFDEIERDAVKFQIKQFAYDRNSAAWIIQEIQKKIPHIELFPFNQSMAGMSAPTKSLTVALRKHRLEHNGNSLAGWCASNAVPENNDAQANMMLHKGKSKDKIDPIVALIMGYNQAELGTMGLEKKFSPYSNDGFKVIKRLEGIKDPKEQ